MPEPKKGESKEKFIARFVGSEEAKKSHPEEKQRLAVALSKWREFSKVKETTAMFTFVKKKESEEQESEEGESSEEEEGDIYTFIGANTLPDRAAGKTHKGEPVVGEVLSKNVLEKMAEYINDETTMGGDYGSYRTVSLFHDRVKTGDYTLEEAAFIKPGSARVVEMENYPGNSMLLVDVELNKFYNPLSHPDYSAEKIKYKIEKGALGLSLEYNNRPDQETIIEMDGKKYNYVHGTDDFRGFGFARPNLIGNTRAVRVKEILLAKELKTNKKGETNMEEAKLKEMEEQLTKANAKIKELEEAKKEAEEAKDEAKLEEVEKKVEEAEEKVKEIKLQMDSSAAKIKESVELAFSSLNFNKPAKTKEAESKAAKLKEIYGAVEAKDFVKFKESVNQSLSANEGKIKEMLARDGNGFDFEKHQTLKVKCVGSNMMVVPTPKTKDVIDSSDMAEGTYNQTNAMFADRYVAGITETFLKEDNLLSAMPKEQHVGGNDSYQWRLWVDFETVTGDNTLAVDPNVTAVQRSQRKFEKMQTPIREYRDGVEVTDFTQHHSMAAVGDLLGLEIQRASEAVVDSMNADLFKPKSDDTAGWKGFVGLLGVADSATYTSLYGKTRSAANRLLDATTANTYVSTAEAISVSVIRSGYEKVLAQGSDLSSLAIVIHPTQMRRLWDTEDSAIRNNILTMAGAPPSFGFNRAVVPHLDGIPMIRDYRCESSAAAADCFGVVDLSPSKGFVLVVSKPLGVRGLAKVGTSESAYVSFWGAAVYKAPRNVFMHDSLTTS